MVISKDIHARYPASAIVQAAHTIMRTGTLKAEGSLGEEDVIRLGSQASEKKVEPKTDNADNFFMEEVIIRSHVLYDIIT